MTVGDEPTPGPQLDPGPPLTVPELDRELDRELTRIADRLRVIGPRLAARATPESLAALARLRAALQRLADLAAAADGRPLRTVPILDAHALADQLLVLGHDAGAPHDVAVLRAARHIIADLRATL